MFARLKSLHAKAATVVAFPWDGCAIKMRIVPINRMKRFAVSSFRCCCFIHAEIDLCLVGYLTDIHSISR